MRNGKVAARPSGFPDCLKARMERGEEEGKLMTWLKGLPGTQAAFGPFGQTESKRKQGFDRQTPAGLRNFVTCQKMT